MSLRLRRSAQARAQLIACSRHIAKQGQPDAALRLLEKYKQLTSDLCDWPRIGHHYDAADTRLTQIRRITIKGYSVSVYYRVNGSWLEVIAVSDGSRSQTAIDRDIRRGTE